MEQIVKRKDIFLMSALGSATTLLIIALVYFFVMNAGSMGNMFVDTFTVEVGTDDDDDDDSEEIATESDSTETDTETEEEETEDDWIVESEDEEEEVEEEEETEEAAEEEEEEEEEEECEDEEVTIAVDEEYTFNGKTIGVSLSDDSAAMIAVGSQSNLLSIDEILDINGVDVWLKDSSSEEVTLMLYCEP